MNFVKCLCLKHCLFFCFFPIDQISAIIKIINTEKNMNRKQLEIFLSSLTLVIAFFSWLSIKNAVVIPDSSTWLVPGILFSIYFILVCLNSLLFRNVLLLELVLVSSLIFSLLFAFSWLQVGAIFLGAYFIFLASRKMRNDMDLNIKINIWKSLQTGRSYLLIAFSLMITMQYFVVINNFGGEKKVPHLDVSFVTKKIAIPFISSISPQFKMLKDDSSTVDQFILQSQKNLFNDNSLSSENEELINSKIPENLTPAEKEALKTQAIKSFADAQSQLSQENRELILSSGRRQFSEMTGVAIIGNEKISDVFTGLVSHKIDTYFNQEVSAGGKEYVFSMILAVVLFLTIYPLGSLLSIFWLAIVELIFFILLKLKLLKIEIITVSKESLR